MNRNEERQGEGVIQEAKGEKQRQSEGRNTVMKKRGKIKGMFQGKKERFYFFQLDTRTDEGLNMRAEMKTRNNSDDKPTFLTQLVTKLVSTKVTFLSG